MMWVRDCLLLLAVGCVPVSFPGRIERLEPDEQRWLTFPADNGLRVFFWFEPESPSWALADECPTYSSSLGARSQWCGALSTEEDAEQPVPTVLGHYEAMVAAEPQDGVVRVRLDSWAHEPMDFVVGAEGVW